MMIFILRFFFAVLIFLQVAGPFLHAHKSSIENLGGSVHLYEFEQFNVSPKHAPEFVAPTNHDVTAIAVSAGIKNETIQLLHAEYIVLALLIGLFYALQNKRLRLYISFQIEQIPNSNFRNSISPRAPPFFSVC